MARTCTKFGLTARGHGELTVRTTFPFQLRSNRRSGLDVPQWTGILHLVIPVAVCLEIGPTLRNQGLLQVVAIECHPPKLKRNFILCKYMRYLCLMHSLGAVKFVA